MKFNKGDTITATELGKGFEKAVVTGTTKQNGKQYYTVKILCGTATIPITAENYYKLYQQSNKK